MISKIKKPVSILLSVIMVFSLFAIVPITASAAEPSVLTSENGVLLINGTAASTINQSYEGTVFNCYRLPAGNYILNSDIMLGKTVLINSGDVNLDIGAYNWTNDNSIGNSGAGAFYVSGGKFTLDGTTGVVCGQNDTLNRGGGMTIYSGTAVMKGGIISGCTATIGTVYCCGSGFFEMQGGEISGNTGWGAIVLQGECRISGGTITNNKNCAIQVWGTSPIYISGNPVISGNLNDSNQECNISLGSSGMITVEGELTDGASIGVTKSSGVFTNSPNTNYNDPTKIFSDNDSYECKLANGQLRLLSSPYSTVTLLPGEAGGSSLNDYVEGGTNYTLPSTISFTAPAGKIFSGWSDGVNTYSPGEVVDTSTAGTEFTAQYTSGKTATFVAGDGSGEGPESICVLAGTSITLPGNTFTAPEGKMFLNWSDGTNTYNVGAQITLNEDTTFTAQWVDGVMIPKTGTDTLDLSEKTSGYSITIFDNGGSTNNYEDYSDGTLSVILPEGKALLISGTINTENGYDYLYVYGGTTENQLIKATGENKTITISSADNPVILRFTSDSSSNKSGFALNAVICDVYSATFYANNGIEESSNTDVSSTFMLPDNTFTVPENKMFAGWKWAEDNQVYPAGSVITLTGESEFYAQWVDVVSAGYTLNDSYGDGWNGANLIVREQGSTTPTATLTLESGSSSGSLNLPYGKIYELVWMKGSYDSECSFTFTNPYDSSDVFTADSNDCKGYQDNQVLATFYPPEYTITWKLDENTIIDTTTVYYGVQPTHADPTKDADAIYTYIFSGWTPEVVAATEDATYTATFSKSVNKYTVTWNNQGTITTEEVDYSTVPSYGSTPTKAADLLYTYTFAGWNDGTTTYAPDAALPEVKGDVTYTATFTAVPKPHTHDGVTFTEWTSTNSLPNTEGNYYLTSDVTLSGTWTVPTGTTNLCLNGHGIIRTGSGRVIDLSSSGRNLNIYDCDTVTEHRFTVNNPTENGAGVAVVNDALTENYQTFTGGYITGGNTNNGAGIHVKQATLKLYGGTVIGNSNTGDGGGIYVEQGGNLYIDGGTVSYNQARQGGGIYAPNISSFAKIHLNSGRIEKNYATYTGGGVYGGANVPVYLEGSIVVTGNYSLNAAGVTAAWNQSSARIYVSGSPYVYDNFNAKGQSNVSGAYYENTMRITGNLGADCKVGLNGANGLLNYYKSDYTHTDIDPNTLFPYDNNNYILTKDGKDAKRLSIYTVTWNNDDDSLIDKTKVVEGDTPTHADPTKPDDAQYTYTFAGWQNGTTTYAPDTALPPVTGDTTYTATFTQTKKKLFAKHSIALNGNIGVNFFINSAYADFDGAQTATVVFTWDDGNYTKVVNLKELTKDSDGLYKATCDVVAAHMAHKIHAEVFIDGVLQEETDDFSVQDHAEAILADPAKYDKRNNPEALVALVKEMLNYGAMAQIAFESNLNEKPAPANTKAISDYDYVMADVTADDVLNAIKESNNGKSGADMTAVAASLGANWYTTTMIYMSQNTVKHYFTKATDDFVPTDYQGNQNNYYYYVQKQDIAAAELDGLQTFTVGDVTFQYSALDYVKTVIESNKMEDYAKNIAKALFLYNQAANAYFDTPVIITT